MENTRTTMRFTKDEVEERAYWLVNDACKTYGRGFYEEFRFAVDQVLKSEIKEESRKTYTRTELNKILNMCQDAIDERIPG